MEQSGVKLTSRYSEMPGVCSHCRRLMITCPCLKMAKLTVYEGQYPRTYKKVTPADDILSEGILDVEGIEAQPGPVNDVDMEDPFCEKSDQHEDFIHADMFALHHLPKDIQHQSVYEWIRSCAPFVVRLLCDKIVGKRRSLIRERATGRACLIPDEYDKTITCKNPDCPYLHVLGPNHELHGGLGIITNCHVVQNDDHASMTTVEFFFDSSEHRDDVVIAFGTTVHLTNKKMDYTVFKCYVHKKGLITMIERLDKLRNKSWQDIPKHVRELCQKYAIVISHPHGASKKISIGDVVEREIKGKNGTGSENAQLLRSLYDLCERSSVYRRDRNDSLLRFMEYYRQVPTLELPYTVTWYSTATCQGSSGAPVYMGNTVMENGEEINQAHTHRGRNETKKLNNCFT